MDIVSAGAVVAAGVGRSLGKGLLPRSACCVGRSAEDDSLPRLARYLASIHGVLDVRVLEKRGWYEMEDRVGGPVAPSGAAREPRGPPRGG